MLPATARLTNSREFRSVTRRGRRAGRSRLVVHALRDESVTEGPARAGFVVSKAVGNSVVRHRVTRQLRHLVRDRIDRLPPGTQLVVRALPAAAGSRSSALAADLDSALDRLRLPGSRTGES
ncbi:ribonuclease P protein component [Sciscionella sediminilitoris]|uniref:ribonuclease P protein component n=1 Tax=Sciscionella sediminilitoris TaxID=1445613 RepID=UPI0004DFC7DE|nr:ribonuclease P protein component [Sciscionella sp. SE31]